MTENQNIEYKQSWHDDYMKWVCGFANAVGGVIYIGKDVTDLRFHEIIEGNLVYMVKEAMVQLDYKFLVRPVEFSGLYRIEKREYPEPALKEMILNAVVHRTYMGATVQMRVFDNRLTIWNEGPLPSGLSVEKLKEEHSSLPRNPLIAEACFKAGYIDAWGRGIMKIMNSCKEAGLPDPEFLEKNGGMQVVLYKDVAPQVTDPVTAINDPVSDQDSDQDSDQLVKILELIKNNPISTCKLRELIGISHKTYFRKNYIDPALNEGFIEMTIPDKPKSKNQKYRITDKGLKYLKDRK